MKRVLALLTLALGLLFAPAVAAHARSVSYSTIRLEGSRAKLRLSLSLLDASLLEASGLTRDALSAYAVRSLRLSSSGGACVVEPASVHEIESQPSAVQLEWRVRCPSTEGLRIASELFISENVGHLHFARWLTPDRPEGVELVLDAANPSAALPSPERAGVAETRFVRFVRMGVEHIASGWDHLVFVFVLVLAGTTLRRTALVVTGFTLGHSVTLALATLGLVAPHAGPVEAAIGLSIALLALENAWMAQKRQRALVPAWGVGLLGLVALISLGLGRGSAVSLLGFTLFAACYFAAIRRIERPDLARVAVAALFGLVHGLGFARVLSEMCLPRTHLVRALVGFNLGVELGQIAFVALAWPLVCVLRTQSDTRRSALVSVGSSLALCLGTYWLVLRTFS